MTGIITDPAKFADVIASSRVIPGDVIVMRAGTYAGSWTVNVGGTKAQPVTIKPYPGEQVVIDGSLYLMQPHIKIYDVEIMQSDPDKTQIVDGIVMEQDDCWLIGCDIHDLRASGVAWFGSGEGGVVECYIHYNGYTVEGVGQGHGVYTHNHNGGARSIARNLFTDQRGKYTIQIYSGGGNYLRDYTCEDNVIFGDPVHTGGGLGLKDFIYRNNIQCGDYCQQGRYGYDNGQNENGQITDNIFFDLTSYTVNQDCSFEWLNLTESGNEVWRGEPSNRAGYTITGVPASWSRFIPFTLSERWSGIQCTLTDGVFDAAMVTFA